MNRGAVVITVRDGDVLSIDETIDIVIKKRTGASGFRLAILAPKEMQIRRTPTKFYQREDYGYKPSNDGRS